MPWTTPTDRTTGYTVTAADWNIVEDDLTYLYGDAAWTTVTSFTNSWADFASGTGPVGYRKIGTRVELRGAVKSGTISTAAFTLPAGYRPLGALNIATVSNSAFGYLQVSTAGAVTPAVGSNVWVSLDNVSFDTI